MSEFQFLSAEKQRLMLQNRFDISFSKFHKVLDNKLTILPCNNMYEALSYAYTGLLKYGETFRQKILKFMKNSWINKMPNSINAKLNRFTESLNISKTLYVIRQKNRCYPGKPSNLFQDFRPYCTQHSHT